MNLWQKRYRCARALPVLPLEHKIHIFGPTCNVLFITWRPHAADVVDIANFYFIVFEQSRQFYKSPFVFVENTKHPCPGYRAELQTEFQSNKVLFN